MELYSRKELSYADSNLAQCIEGELITRVLDDMGFAYNEENVDMCSTDLKDIANHNTVKLVLSHQENRCICYQYFPYDWRKNNHLVVTPQRLAGMTDFWKKYHMQTQLDVMPWKITSNSFPGIYIMCNQGIRSTWIIVAWAIYIRTDWMCKAPCISEVPAPSSW